VLTLIVNGDVYAPEPLGRRPILLVGSRIARAGSVDRSACEALDVGFEVIDAEGCVVVPGLIDPHEHLLGGSGEQGFATQTPEITLEEILLGGITSVVGCLGVDTTMKTPAGLLGRVKALREEGLGAWMWSGGYDVPPTSILESVRDDLMFIDEVIGCGEVAISDERSVDPDPRELARVAHDAYVGGMLSGKAGLTHFHVGEGERRLRCLREILDRERFQVDPAWLYVTHVQRNSELLCEAIGLARAGAAVDFDVAAHDLAKWLSCYREENGPPDRLTISSDASISSPGAVLAQIRDCVFRQGFALEEVLPLATANPARILRLERKGRIGPGMDADLLVLRRDSLELVEVIAGGRRLVAGGALAAHERFLDHTERTIHLQGRSGSSG
jgi:beta-aspartyl-dipeptidase (metallo-type)